MTPSDDMPISAISNFLNSSLMIMIKYNVFRLKMLSVSNNKDTSRGIFFLNNILFLNRTQITRNYICFRLNFKLSANITFYVRTASNFIIKILHDIYIQYLLSYCKITFLINEKNGCIYKTLTFARCIQVVLFVGLCIRFR